MATDLRQLPAYLSNDADFRAWGSGIAAQLAAVGLVKTLDTGQINWATVARPGSPGYGGYEMWRFNDALQATKPVFIRVDYGVVGTVDRPAVHMTVSTATNGAGTSTGQVGPVRAVNASASKSAGITLPSYCSGSTSRLTLVTNLDFGSANFSMWHLIERTKTVTGVDTGDGIVGFSGCASANTNWFQMVPFSGAIPTRSFVNMATSLSSAGISSVGPNIALSPTIAPLGKPFFASWCAYLHADLGELQPFAADHLGANHTFMALGDGVSASSGSSALVQGTATGHSLAILWE